MWSRRQVLRSAAALALAGPTSQLLLGAHAAGAGEATGEVFPQSVASGDPTPTGAVVWTRVAPQAAAAGHDVELLVSGDAELQDVVARERIAAATIGPHSDFTVRVDLDGRLAPDRRFFYRFRYGGASSPIGRLRTLPAADAEVPGLRFALASCQNVVRGHLNAYRHVADDELDYILHVGDFIYEEAGQRGAALRTLVLPSGGAVARRLDDYRSIHRAYRSDAALQRALERHTLIAIWDDHEVANDRYWDAAAGRLRAPDHPLDGDATASDAVHAGGIRAFWEYLPVRPPYDERASLRDRLRLERSFRFGKLAELHLSDTRLARDPHPCGEKAVGERLFRMEAKCPGRTADDRTMLGAEQRTRLIDGLARSDARWKLWATPVPLTPFGYGSGAGRLFLTLDSWAGYASERRAILGALAARGVTNLVSLTGDLHAFFTAPLFVDDVDPLRELPKAMGVEIGTGALSAPALGAILPVLSDPDVVRENNPQIELWNALANGYTRVEIGPDEIRYEPLGFAVDRVLERVEARSLGRFRARAGSSRIDRL